MALLLVPWPACSVCVSVFRCRGRRWKETCPGLPYFSCREGPRPCTASLCTASLSRIESCDSKNSVEQHKLLHTTCFLETPARRRVGRPVCVGSIIACQDHTDSKLQVCVFPLLTRRIQSEALSAHLNCKSSGNAMRAEARFLCGGFGH